MKLRNMAVIQSLMFASSFLVSSNSAQAFFPHTCTIIDQYGGSTTWYCGWGKGSCGSMYTYVGGGTSCVFLAGWCSC